MIPLWQRKPLPIFLLKTKESTKFLPLNNRNIKDRGGVFKNGPLEYLIMFLDIYQKYIEVMDTDVIVRKFVFLQKLLQGEDFQIFNFLLN